MLSRTGCFAVSLFYLLAPQIGTAQAIVTACVTSHINGHPIDGAFVQLMDGGESRGVLVTDLGGCATFDSTSTSTGEGIPIPERLLVGAPFPNPTSGMVTIPITAPDAGVMNYEIFDITGRRLSHGHTYIGSRNADVRLNLTGRPPGVYFTRLQKGRSIHTARLVVSGGGESGVTGGIDHTLAADYLSAAGLLGTKKGSTLQDSATVHVAVLAEAAEGPSFGFSKRFVARRDTLLALSFGPGDEACIGGDGSGEEVETFLVVDEIPELIGGLESVQDRIEYPDIARRAGVEGRVFVQFIVDRCGRVSDAVVVRGIGAGCDEEALRVLLSASFVPGRHDGEPVRVRISIPITFSLR